MAYRRCVCTRATLLARRLNPSFSYISHNHDKTNDNNNHESMPSRKIDDFLTQRRSFGTYINNSMALGSLFHNQRSFFPGNRNEVNNFSHRFMSTSIGNETNNSEFISDVAGVISDAPIEAVASQLPAVNEVAIAAADSAFPVAALQYVIDAVHSFTGLNWWASIALTTLLIRGCTVPFLINQLKATSKLSIMRPRLEAIKEEMEAKGHDPEAMQEGKQKMNALFKEYGVTPFTPMKGIFIQGPIFISFFLAISNMVEKVPSFKQGGAFWFTDLTTPDSMYIFPVLTALTFLVTVECNMQEGMEGNPVAGTMKKFSRGLAVLTVPFTMSFPQAIFCYWITSNCFSFFYGLVLKIPGLKEALGIPKIPIEPPSTSQKSSLSFFEAIKKASETASRMSKHASLPVSSDDQAKAINGKSSTSSSSSSAVLSQRIKSLERQVKQKRKNKKR